MRFTAFLQHGVPKKTQKFVRWLRRRPTAADFSWLGSQSRDIRYAKKCAAVRSGQKVDFFIAPTVNHGFDIFSLKCVTCQPGPFSHILQHRTFFSFGAKGRLQGLVRLTYHPPTQRNRRKGMPPRGGMLNNPPPNPEDSTQGNASKGWVVERPTPQPRGFDATVYAWRRSLQGFYKM